MKIEQENQSWLFLQNIWEANTTVLSLYAVGLASDSNMFLKNLSVASLWILKDPTDHGQEERVTSCAYIPNRKDVSLS
jgi:hypothetical protein